MSVSGSLVAASRELPTCLTSRRDRSGALVWIFAIQFFITQLVVAHGWTTPFSLRTNFISDLGNTACDPNGQPGTGYVCSPWHLLMNASFIVLGLTIVAGTFLNRKRFGLTWTSLAGMILLALSGLGVFLVGIYPENLGMSAHKAGAGLNFVGGNLGIAILGRTLRLQHMKGLAIYSVISGITGLAATVLFVQGQYLGLGIGGMERVAAYPIPVWLMVAGAVFVQRSRREHLKEAPRN